MSVCRKKKTLFLILFCRKKTLGLTHYEDENACYLSHEFIKLNKPVRFNGKINVHFITIPRRFNEL